MKTYIRELMQRIVYRGWFIHENVYMGTDTEDSLLRLVYSRKRIYMGTDAEDSL